MRKVSQLDDMRKKKQTQDRSQVSNDPAPQLATMIIELLASEMKYTLTEKLAALTLAARALTDTVSDTLSMAKAREMAIKAMRLADSYIINGSRK